MTLEEAFVFLRSLPEGWGASESEVKEVESGLRARLPDPLRNMMLCTGSVEHMRWLFPDVEIAPLAELPRLKEMAAEILESDAPALRPTLPFVVLSQHEGYFFSFVEAEGPDTDPEVLGYRQGHGFDSRPYYGSESIGQKIASAVRRALSRPAGHEKGPERL